MNEYLSIVITHLTGDTAEIITTRRYIIDITPKSANLRNEVMALIETMLDQVIALENQQDLSD